MAMHLENNCKSGVTRHQVTNAVHAIGFTPDISIGRSIEGGNPQNIIALSSLDDIIQWAFIIDYLSIVCYGSFLRWLSLHNTYVHSWSNAAEKNSRVSKLSTNISARQHTTMINLNVLDVIPFSSWFPGSSLTATVDFAPRMRPPWGSKNSNLHQTGF